MKRHIPEADALAAAMTRRLDKAEARLAVLDELRDDVATLARGLADLSAQVRRLGNTNTIRLLRTAGQDGPADNTTPSEAPQGDGQPDWLLVSDAATAIQWLTDVMAFTHDILAPLGMAPTSGCWMLHPQVVTELLALQAEYRASYSSENPTRVCELLGRWLPGAHSRITTVLGGCFGERAHRVDGRAYEIPRLDPVHVATWWVDTHGRDPGPVEAFALTRIA